MGGGWLQFLEVFSLTISDVVAVLPVDGPHYNFPPRTGAILYKLLPETKNSPYATAYLILANIFASGLQPQYWLLELQSTLQMLGWTHGPLFCHPTGALWDSTFF